MTTYKGIPSKLIVINTKTVGKNTYVLVNGYSNPSKIVGYSNENSERFMSYRDTQFKNTKDAASWLANK